jgi:translocation and assembly module TamB
LKRPQISKSRLPAAILALIVLLLAAVAGLWWWSGTEGSLEWVLRRIARSQPLTAEGVKGSLRSGLHVQRLVWERDGVKIEASDVELAWQPLWLLEGTIKLDRVRAAALRITDRRPPSPEPFRLPESLAIRPDLELDDLAIAQLDWIAAQPVQAYGLTGRYWFDGKAHWLRVNSLNVLGGTYRGHASLGAQAPLPLDAGLSGQFDAPVPGAATKLPLQFTVTLRGPIADLQAQGWVRASGAAAATQAPQATATARITPWAAQPVPQAQAELRGLDLAGLWPQAPQTRLAGNVQLAPAGTATWHVSADLRNEIPGPWDQGRLPLEQLQAQGEWRAGTALVQDLDGKVGGGRVNAAGQWKAQSNDWTVKGEVKGVDPAALHSAMAAAPLSGRVEVQQESGAVAFDLRLQGSGRGPKPAVRRNRSESAKLASAVRALQLRQVMASGRWAQGRLALPKLQLRTSDASLQGAIEVEPAARAGRGRLELRSPGLRARLAGEVAEARGGGTLQAEGTDLALTQRWLQRVPGVPAAVSATGVGGQAVLRLAWQGGWRDPQVQAGLSSPALELRGHATAAAGWSMHDVAATLNGRLSDASLVAHAKARQGQRQVSLDIAGRGGRAPLRSGAPEVWRARIATLGLSVQDPAVSAGTWQLASQRAFDLRWSPAGKSLDVSAGQALFSAPALKSVATPTQAVLAWDPVRWGGGELRTSGRLTGLPLAWVELVGGPQLAGSALSGDMVFDAQWDASLGRSVKLNASLARSRGDITVLAETLQGVSSRVPAGVRDARLTLASQGEQVTLTLHWDSERAGTADGRLVTRLSPGGGAGWQWPAGAPINGSLRARLPRIGVWSVLAPPGWRLRGSLSADVRAAGTRGDPQLSGNIAADELALRSVVDGIELRNGRLRAGLQGNRLLVTEFTLRGAGERDGGGSLVASGEAAWVNGAPQVRATAQLTRLRASIRSDRQLTASGNLAARLDAAGAEVTGRIKVDQARIVLPEENEPKLGDDVVVRNAPAGALTRDRQPEAAAALAGRPVAVAVDLDLGEDFQVRGRGLQTRLRGTLALSGRSVTAPRLVGTITTAGGEYRAYNQRLDVERGVLRFTGRIDNPALDILAIRPNITQRVGVLITGNAQAPFIRLYAEPDLPDAEKLAWLVTGRAAPSGGAEAALVQEAALALLSSRRSGGRGLAGSLGLDQLSVRRESSEGAVVTLGKRFARNFYASYERSLSGALGTLYIFYDVSRRMTVRAQAGERAGVDLIFTFSFD